MMKRKPTQLLTLLCIFLLALSIQGLSQNVVSGVVKDSEGNAANGATILLKGTNQSAVASETGAFQLSSKRELPYTLIVSYVGYKPVEVPVAELGSPLAIKLATVNQSSDVVITSRRRKEAAQAVPIALSIIGGAQVEEAGAFNVNRLKELVPNVQLYSSNPRNTTLNIRGMGSTFGLTNDGIDPGVGFYVDGVYYARPAATTLDFIDIEQIEVLRGPQGTLFGKNTTAGAFNITTRAPTFRPGANFEVSYGNFGFVQAKASVTGGLGDKFAGRISFSGTQRSGLLENVATQKPENSLNNLGIRGQLLYKPSDNFSITFIGDATRQRPDGFAQVLAGVVTTQRPAYRQFEAIITDLNYKPVSYNAFDRKIDHNSTWRSGNDLGGASVNLEAKVGKGTLTSTTAWRYWKWDPSNDRDFTGLAVLQKSQATSKHHQWSQEVRYAGDFSNKLSGVAGVFLLGQNLESDPVQIEESGNAQWRFSQSTTSPLWATPGLFDGYGIKTTSRLKSLGAAVFGQLDWAITESLHLLPGLRYNYDKKDVDFSRLTYGGLQTTDPALIALKRLVYSDQAFVASAEESNFSGQLTLTFKPHENVNSFVTYSTSYKPVGVNLGGLPTLGGLPMLQLATIKPEYVKHFEAGVKTKPGKNTILNAVFFTTDIDDYQTQVQTAEVGVNRGYLANAEKVRVMGAEVDFSSKIKKFITLNGALAYTDGKYVSFTNAPVPLEETGSRNAFKDISGEKLPGISRWAGSLSGEIASKKTKKLFDNSGKLFFAIDLYYRSGFSSSPSPSKYLNVDGYTLANSRFGFRAAHGLSMFFWVRNALDKNYFEQLLPAAGNAGHYAGVLGDQRTFGITLRYSL